MSSRWQSYGGAHSPFQASDPRIPPIVTDDDYHYMTADDIVDPPTYIRRSPPRHDYGSSRSTRGSLDDDGPDILILKHKTRTYPLHFQAYSIGESLLKVADLRKKAALETGYVRDPHRVKLLYKGKSLRDDNKTCREEGLKQNSEIMCVITEPGSRGDSSESADESDMLNELGAGAAPGGGVRINVDGSIIEPARPKRRKNHRSGKASSRTKSPSRKSNASSRVPDDYHSRGTRTSSPQPLHTQPAPSRPRRSPSPPAAPVDPNTPLGKIIQIQKAMRADFFPACDAFLDSPPPDTKARENEYKRLSEGLLNQVIIKLDSVETEGDEAARANRKALVQECQAMLNDLDAKQKASSGRR